MAEFRYAIFINGLKGDINGDINVNLTDAILAMKVLAGADPTDIRSDYANLGVDINGDGKIGIGEIIYILQKVAGIYALYFSLVGRCGNLLPGADLL